jgi:hypothetical protein
MAMKLTNWRRPAQTLVSPVKATDTAPLNQGTDSRRPEQTKPKPKESTPVNLTDNIEPSRKQVLQVRYMLQQLVNHDKNVHDLRKITHLQIPEISSRIGTFGIQALKLLEARGVSRREIISAMAANDEMATAFKHTDQQQQQLSYLIECVGRAVHHMAQGMYVGKMASEAGLAPEILNHHIAVFNLGLIAYLDYYYVKENVVCDAMVKCLCGLEPGEALKQAERGDKDVPVVWTRMWYNTRSFLS